MKLIFPFFVSGWVFLLISCGEQHPPTDMTDHSLIPKPVSIAATNGTFVLDDDVTIYFDAGNFGFRGPAAWRQMK